MDELNHTFGQLSTSAAEWKPASSSLSSAVASAEMVPPESDLKASAVKEFVPGRGWVTEALHKGKSGLVLWNCCSIFSMWLVLVWPLRLYYDLSSATRIRKTTHLLDYYLRCHLPPHNN